MKTIDTVDFEKFWNLLVITTQTADTADDRIFRWNLDENTKHLIKKLLQF